MKLSWIINMDANVITRVPVRGRQASESQRKDEVREAEA